MSQPKYGKILNIGLCVYITVQVSYLLISENLSIKKHPHPLFLNSLRVLSDGRYRVIGSPLLTLDRHAHWISSVSA